jgi:hypothetical protein
MGEEKFIDALKIFYRQAGIKGKVNITDFKNIMRENGASEDLLDWFMNNI